MNNIKAHSVLRFFVNAFAVLFVVLTIATYRFVYYTGPRAKAFHSDNTQLRAAISREIGIARFIVGPVLIGMVWAHYRAAFHRSRGAQIIIVSMATLMVFMSVVGLCCISLPRRELPQVTITGFVAILYLVVMLVWFSSNQIGMNSKKFLDSKSASHVQL